MSDIKTYATNLKTAIDADTTLKVYNEETYIIVSETNKSREELVKELVKDHKNIIVITNVTMDQPIPWTSNNGQLYPFRSEVICVLNSTERIGIVTKIITAIFGTPVRGKELATVAKNVNTCLLNNKLSAYCNLGGRILDSPASEYIGDGIYIKILIHEGKRFE